MKAIIKAEPGVGLSLVDLPIPTPGPKEILIRVKAAAICGSDVPVYDWSDPWARATVRNGQIIGHEFVGTVVQSGAHVAGFSIGDLVTAEGHLFCGSCFHCRRGEAHICPRQKLIGFDAPGAFAEFVCVPAANVLSLPALPLVFAAMLDPLGNAVHAAQKAALADADILVTGCGPIGLMVASIARHRGARRVFASDPSKFRRALASTVGADDLYDSQNNDLPSIVIPQSQSGSGVDVLMEMSGNPKAIVQGLKTVRPGGDAILLGLPKQEILCDLANDVIAKGITVHGIIGRTLFTTWQQALTVLGTELSRQSIGLRHVVTHLLPMEEFDRGFSLMQRAECGKVVICMDSESLAEAKAQCAALGLSNVDKS